jgi:hypothetical protein
MKQNANPQSQTFSRLRLYCRDGDGVDDVFGFAAA